MSRQLALMASEDQESPSLGYHAQAEREIMALAGDIRQIGRRLRNSRAFDHPTVRAALGQFDNELAVAFGQSHGRHRIMTSRERQLDAFSSGAEFMRELRQLRTSCGDISFRQMAERSGHVVAHSAMCMALNGVELPPLKVVLAIVVGCGGSTAYKDHFAAAWHHLRR